MIISPEQYDAAIAAAARVERKLIEAKTLSSLGMDHRANMKAESAITAFESLAAAMCIALSQTDQDVASSDRADMAGVE